MTTQQPPEFLSADCERVQDALFSQLETDVPVSLNPDAQAFLDMHLVHCAACRMYRHSMRHLQSSLQELELVETPAGLEDRIMGKIAGLSGEGAEIREAVGYAAPRGFNWKKFAPLAAAVLVVAVTVPLVLQSLAPQTRSASPQVAQTQKAAFPQKAVTPVQTANPALKAHPEIATAVNNPEQPQPQAGPEPATPNMPMQKGASAHANATPQRHGQQLALNASDHNDVQGAPPVEQSASATSADALQIASANVSQPFGDTYASENESDVYYDPVSTLVGF